MSTILEVAPVLIPFHAARVEHELARLRRDHVAARGASFPEVRASVATVVVWAGGVDEGTECSDHVTALAARHPCRLLVVEPGEGPVAAVCIDQNGRCPAGSAADIQSEHVVLTGARPDQLASAVEQLLLPDVPVILWAPHEPLPEQARRLVDVADRVVADTHTAVDPDAVARWLDGLSREGTVVSDLEWSRLTPWRALMASFFDPPERHALLDSLSSVWVGVVGAAYRGRLVAGWVLDRLGLSPDDVSVHLESVPPPFAHGMTPGHLVGFVLTVGDDRFSVWRGGRGRLVAEERVNGRSTVRVVPYRSRTTVDALTEELDQGDQDLAFLGALRRSLTE